MLITLCLCIKDFYYRVLICCVLWCCVWSSPSEIVVAIAEQIGGGGPKSSSRNGSGRGAASRRSVGRRSRHHSCHSGCHRVEMLLMLLLLLLVMLLWHKVVRMICVFLEPLGLLVHALLDLQNGRRFRLIVLAGSAESAQIVVTHAAARVFARRPRSSVGRRVFHAIQTGSVRTAAAIKYGAH